MPAHQFTIIIVIFLNLILGSVIFLRGKRSKSTLWYSIAVFSIIGWSFSDLSFEMTHNESFARFWHLVSLATPTLTTFAFSFFTIYFPTDKPRTGKAGRGLLIAGFFITVAVLFFPGTIRDIGMDNVPRSVEYGAWQFYFFTLYIFLALTYAFVNVFAAYFESPKPFRKNIALIFIGAAITSFFAILGGIVLPLLGNFHFLWIGSVCTVFVFVFTGIAIIRFQLLNIKIVAVEIITILIELILILEIFLSKKPAQFILRLIVALFVGIFGYFLTRGVNKEVEMRKEMEELTMELQRTNIELQKLDEAKSEFLAIASHQLRTPLTAIKGFISMILEGMYGQTGTRERTTLEKVYISNERLVKLVNDLLDISKIEAGGFKYEWNEVNVHTTLLEVISELERSAIAKGLFLRIEPGDRRISITADGPKLRQVFLNIIDNAIRYTEQGGITVRIQAAEDHVLISIQDTGIGLEPEEVTQLFQKYARGKSSRIGEGTGLGLYVAKRIVEDHKGKISVESAGKDKGSTFFIQLQKKLRPEEMLHKDSRALEHKT